MITPPNPARMLGLFIHDTRKGGATYQARQGEAEVGA